MLYNRQQANNGTSYVVARAYSLEQQNAGRAHAGLCHASSFIDDGILQMMMMIGWLMAGSESVV